MVQDALQIPQDYLSVKELELNSRHAAEVENNSSKEKMGPGRGLAVVIAETWNILAQQSSVLWKHRLTTRNWITETGESVTLLGAAVVVGAPWGFLPSGLGIAAVGGNIVYVNYQALHSSLKMCGV